MTLKPPRFRLDWIACAMRGSGSFMGARSLIETPFGYPARLSRALEATGLPLPLLAGNALNSST